MTDWKYKIRAEGPVTSDEVEHIRGDIDRVADDIRWLTKSASTDPIRDRMLSVRNVLRTQLHLLNDAIQDVREAEEDAREVEANKRRRAAYGDVEGKS